MTWRGTALTVRELPHSSLENSEGDWKLVIDFPFDEAGHGMQRVDGPACHTKGRAVERRYRPKPLDD